MFVQWDAFSNSARRLAINVLFKCGKVIHTFSTVNVVYKNVTSINLFIHPYFRLEPYLKIVMLYTISCSPIRYLCGNTIHCVHITGP